MDFLKIFQLRLLLCFLALCVMGTSYAQNKEGILKRFPDGFEENTPSFRSGPADVQYKMNIDRSQKNSYRGKSHISIRVDAGQGSYVYAIYDLNAKIAIIDELKLSLILYIPTPIIIF